MSVQTIKHIIVGTAGHIDHGKSALVEALTGTNPDRLAEEKRRGITIDLGFAFCQLGDVRLGLIDVPGHERFVRNMLAGVGGIDLVLMVIAADEAVKPQTREHFDICRLFYCKIKAPKDYLGLLPYRTKSGLISPIGTFEGWYFSEEIRFAYENGYEIIVINGYQFDKSENVFNSYVNNLYEIKSTTKDDIIKAITKSFLNNLLGR
jgi:hypothetical protein